MARYTFIVTFAGEYIEIHSVIITFVKEDNLMSIVSEQLCAEISNLRNVTKMHKTKRGNLLLFNKFTAN